MTSLSPASRAAWELTTPAPPREVFAVMEQLIGTPPFRFEVMATDRARIIEDRRRGWAGQWTSPRRRLGWVECAASRDVAATAVVITASAGRAVRSRAEQLAQLLQRGESDPRTIYRARRIPAGPVTLVASWAGTPYRLLREPSAEAARGPSITTATRLWTDRGAEGPFCEVRLADGEVGWVETDQIVAAPAAATRAAQLEAAKFG